MRSLVVTSLPLIVTLKTNFTTTDLCCRIPCISGCWHTVFVRDGCDIFIVLPKSFPFIKVYIYITVVNSYTITRRHFASKDFHLNSDKACQAISSYFFFVRRTLLRLATHSTGITHRVHCTQIHSPPFSSRTLYNSFSSSLSLLFSPNSSNTWFVRRFSLISYQIPYLILCL